MISYQTYLVADIFGIRMIMLYPTDMFWLYLTCILYIIIASMGFGSCNQWIWMIWPTIWWSVSNAEAFSGRTNWVGRILSKTSQLKGSQHDQCPQGYSATLQSKTGHCSWHRRLTWMVWISQIGQSEFWGSPYFGWTPSRKCCPTFSLEAQFLTSLPLPGKASKVP